MDWIRIQTQITINMRRNLYKNPQFAFLDKFFILIPSVEIVSIKSEKLYWIKSAALGEKNYEATYRLVHKCEGTLGEL